MVNKYERFYLPQSATTRGINRSYQRAVWKRARTELFFATGQVIKRWNLLAQDVYVRNLMCSKAVKAIHRKVCELYKTQKWIPPLQI